MTIDIDKMKERKTELETELASLNSFITMAEKYGVNGTSHVPPATPTIPLPLPLPLESSRLPFTQGHRKLVVLALHTGSSTQKDVQRALGWDHKKIHAVIADMLRRKLIYLGEHGMLSLAAEGKIQAQWYLAHPDYTKYMPGVAK